MTAENLPTHAKENAPEKTPFERVASVITRTCALFIGIGIAGCYLEARGEHEEIAAWLKNIFNTGAISTTLVTLYLVVGGDEE